MEELKSADPSGFDGLVQRLYALAIEGDWQNFRAAGLAAVLQWTGASAGAWLTRSAGNTVGEFTQVPAGAGFNRAQLISASPANDKAAASELDSILLPGSELRLAAMHRQELVHVGGELRSTLLLGFPAGQQAQPHLARALGHLVEAGSLALHHYIQRDEWLMALGRSNRGTAAIVDARGAIYAASHTFRDLLAEHVEVSADFAALPFSIPEPALEGDEAFFQGPLHFRISTLGGNHQHLYQLHARRPLPLDALSPREQQIARALGNGKTFKTVARQYDIAVSTVANHASRIYRKLGIYRREDLVDLVRRPGSKKAANIA